MRPNFRIKWSKRASGAVVYEQGVAVEADKETLLEISADNSVYRIVTEETVN